MDDIKSALEIAMEKVAKLGEAHSLSHPSRVTA